MNKKFLSIVLCLCLVASVFAALPLTAFADLNDTQAATPTVEVSHPSMVFTTDTLDITITLKNAESGTYRIGNSKWKPFSDTITITIGSGVAFGVCITVQVNAKGSESAKAYGFDYIKVNPDSKVYVYYDNNNTNWQKVNCYIYTDPAITSTTEWLEVPMTKTQGNIYYYEVPIEFWNGRVTFNNALTGEQLQQIPESKGYAIEGRTNIFQDNQWQYYKAPAPILGDADGDGNVTISDVTAIQKHLAQIKLLDSNKLKATNADGQDGVTIADATAVQKYLAQLPTNENIGQPME
ncbi:MAG: starch-binding protein [Oscillospiraceae bacterium]|jgi:hypothetical protein|nr:starch-binding protein [Oscillospiraceae bacterium]